MTAIFVIKERVGIKGILLLESLLTFPFSRVGRFKLIPCELVYTGQTTDFNNSGTINQFVRIMTFRCGGVNLKALFTVLLVAANGSLLLMSFKVHLRGIFSSQQKRKERSGFQEDTKAARVHVHKFDMRGHNVMVFLHIQKTGGSQFGGQLVKNLDIERPCRCSRRRGPLNLKTELAKPKLKNKRQCQCFRPGSTSIWLFSRHHLGWPCGLHADWTEHHECVPKYMNTREGKNPQRRYFYVTIIREPVSRFLSEFSFVTSMGSMWNAATLRCKGRSPTKIELLSCFTEKNLSDVTLNEFMGCPWNLAINRQTRMLADLRMSNCYNTSGISTSKRKKIMLESAIKNIQEMSYFGLMEHQAESQYLFEKTFNLKFFKPFPQITQNETRAGKIFPTLNNSVLDQIRNLNSLDAELYTFAKRLFFKRIASFRKSET